MKKRGISPILATVLLVAFTIALAAFVSNFLIEQTQEKFDPESVITDSEFCDSVSLGYGVITEDGASQANLNIGDSFTRFEDILIKNKGSFSVRNLTVTGPTGISENPLLIILEDTTGFATNDYQVIDGNPILINGLKPQEEAELRIIFKNYEDTEDDLVKITPWIKDPAESGKYVVCEESSLIIKIEDVNWYSVGGVIDENIGPSNQIGGLDGLLGGEDEGIPPAHNNDEEDESKRGSKKKF